MTEPGAQPRLYLDAAATTHLAPDVARAMTPLFEVPQPAGVLSDARARVAARLGAEPDRVLFSSGGTASNNLAIQGLVRAQPPGRLVSQLTEHPSVLAPLRALEAEGYPVEWLPLNDDGVVDPADVRRVLDAGDVRLVSLMFGNHETGALQPVAEIGELCARVGALLHVDAVQGFATHHVSLATTGADALTCSGHKLWGPKGVGALALSARAPALAEPAPVSPALALGLALALERSRPSRSAIAASRDDLQRRVLDRIDRVVVNAGGAARLPGHLNLSFPGLSGDALVLALDQLGIACSSGAACSSGNESPSPVLMAMGRERPLAIGSLRLSLPRPLSEDEVELCVEALAQADRRLRLVGGSA